MEDVVIDIKGLRKKYKLGTIGGGTLKGEIQSRIALSRGKEDPNAVVGSKANYNKEFWALKGVNLQVRRGERLGIIGRNGAGKSTLLKIISRITAPTEGEITYEGRIASMLEVGTGFHGELTGRENIYMNAAILGMSKSEVDAKMDDIIDFSECGEFIDTPVKRYSSGMYVKLAFSVAAHLDAEIMIMDEVLAVGDVNFQNKCLNKMREIAEDENRTILYVSHNMNTIKKLCNRSIVLDHGKIIYDGDSDEAIEVYLSEGFSDDGENFYLGGRRLGESGRITKVQFNDEDGPFIATAHKEIVVSVTTFEVITEAHFRLLIRYMDTSVVGTFFTEKVDFPVAGNYMVKIDIPFDHLPNASYYVQVVFSKANMDGTNIKISQIDMATKFSINNEKNNCAGLKWNSGWRINLGELPVYVERGIT